MLETTRKVVHRSPAHTARLLHLPHLQPEPIEGDSSLERDFVHVAALYPYVRHIKHQPFKLLLGEKRYTPDFLLKFSDGSKLVVEVKPQSKTGSYEDLFALAKEKLAAHGYQFLVATDTYIHKNGRSDRALKIRRYSKCEFLQADLQTAIDFVAASPSPMSIRSLIGDVSVSYEQILHLISRRLLTTSADLSIGPDATLDVPHQSIMEVSHAIHFASWFNA